MNKLENLTRGNLIEHMSLQHYLMLLLWTITLSWKSNVFFNNLRAGKNVRACYGDAKRVKYYTWFYYIKI